MPRYIEGFEGGNRGLTQWLNDWGTDTPAAGIMHKDDIPSVQSGNKDLKMPRGGNYVFNTVDGQHLFVPITHLFGETQSLYVKLKFQFTYAGQQEDILLLLDRQGNQLASIYQLATGAIYVTSQYLDTNAQYSIYRIPECQWSLFEIYYRLSTRYNTNDGEYEIRVDGRRILYEDNANTNPDVTYSQIINTIAIQGGGSSGTPNWLVDDIAIDTTSSFDTKADGIIIRYEPSANGTTTDWTPDTITVPVGTFYASYDSNINGTYGDGDLTGTATGGAAVSGGKLDLAHNDARYVDYDTTGNISALTQIGCIRFRYTPNYDDYPPVEQVMFHISESAGSNNNRISMTHATNGYSYLYINNSVGGVIMSYSSPRWNAVNGVEHEFEINIDITNGSTKIYKDGFLHGYNQAGTGTRTSNVNLFRIGNNRLVTRVANFSLDKFIVFTSRQHTDDYEVVDYGEDFTGDDYEYIANKGSAEVLDASWLETNEVDKKEMVDLSKDATETPTTIYQVQSHHRVRKYGNSPVNELVPFLYINSTEYLLTPFDEMPISVFTPLLTPIEQNPDTGTDWDPSDFAGMELGIKSQG